MPTDESPPPEGWTPGGTPSPRPLESELDRWGPVRDFLRERLPAGVRGGRLDPGVRGALTVALLALLSSLVAVYFAWSSAARPAASHAAAGPGVAVPKLSGSAGTPIAALPSPTAQAGVVVDVSGKVPRPGLVKLAGGARVADAIAAAGGVLPGASTTGLSLARRLVDGEQLVVGAPQVPPLSLVGSSGSPAAAGPVDLNAATVTDLDALPGIGPVLAQRVVDWRTSHGGFTSVDQLREVSGLGGKKFDTLAPMVRV